MFKYPYEKITQCIFFFIYSLFYVSPHFSVIHVCVCVWQKALARTVIIIMYYL